MYAFYVFREVTSASERAKLYRDKLRETNPEKYAEMNRKSAARLLIFYSCILQNEQKDQTPRKGIGTRRIKLTRRYPF
jgi:hypothetical protein